ncbi:MAG: site-2 protease family protein [Candidatus Thermoplasmatota archaeon]|nr:site-2 protease family protein [Candidatus Thermoplasmatota archaeon]
MESLADEVEEVRALVGRHFAIYDIRVRPEAIAVFVRAEAPQLDERFEALRLEMRGGKYLPLLRLEGGEHILYVQRSPPRRFRGIWLNVVLLAATLATTLIAGMIHWAGYNRSEDILTLSNALYGGLFFTLPLMAILGTHEMGHFILARRHKVAASLPFFIPAPPPVIFGTFGALISMREPIPNKKALLDIGMSGPLLGLAVALPVTLLGLYLNALDPRLAGTNVGGQAVVNLPILYQAMLFAIPIPDNALLHPTAFAGWVGFLVTGLNLLPAGQLDGGHVARALLGDKAKYLSYAAFAILLALGFVFFFSWIILAFLVLFLGLRHPPPLNDITRLDVGRKLAGVGVFVLLILSLHWIPLQEIPVDVAAQFRDPADPLVAIEEDNVTLTNFTANYTFILTITGNVRTVVELSFGSSIENLPDWEILFTSVDNMEIRGENATVILDASRSAVGTILIRAPIFVPPGATRFLEIVGDLRSEAFGGRAQATLSLRIDL